MAENPSEETKIVAIYSTRHDAEIARSFLEDNGINAFVVADDVHVPLQLTEGARLVVMQSHAERASEALADVGLTSSGFGADQEGFFEEEMADERMSPPPSSDERRRTLIPPRRSIVASTMVALLIVVLFFIPWRIERTDDIIWAPFYRPPITHTTTFQELGGARVNYEKGEVAPGILLVQVLGVAVAGWISLMLTKSRPEG